MGCWNFGVSRKYRLQFGKSSRAMYNVLSYYYMYVCVYIYDYLILLHGKSYIIAFLYSFCSLITQHYLDNWQSL